MVYDAKEWRKTFQARVYEVHDKKTRKSSYAVKILDEFGGHHWKCDSRLFSSLDELKILLDMRWPDVFLDVKTTCPGHRCFKIEGIPQEVLKECAKDSRPVI